MNVPFRPIGKIREMVQSTGLDISHFYDDLVISNYSVFIIQFDNSSESMIHLYFNTDCELSEQRRIYRCLLPESLSAGIDLQLSGTFSIEQIEKTEEIKITFFQNSTLPNL